MSEWRTFLGELRAPKSDVAVLLTTFVLTVLVDLTVAIEVGMVLAAFLFMRRMATVTNVQYRLERRRRRHVDSTRRNRGVWQIPPGVTVFEINGPFFFGAVEAFRETLDHLAEHPRVLIIRMRDVHALDSTGLHAIKDVVRRSRKSGSDVLLADVQAQPFGALSDSRALDEIGAENVFPEIDDALARAYELTHAGSSRVSVSPTSGA